MESQHMPVNKAQPRQRDMNALRQSSHLERRLGYIKAHGLLCDVATVSGMTFSGYIASFDDSTIVVRPANSNNPADLITVMMRGLEFIAPFDSVEH